MAIHPRDVSAVCDALGENEPSLESIAKAAESVSDADLSKMLCHFASRAGVRERLLAKVKHEMEKRKG